MIPSESLPRPGIEAGLKLLAGTRVLDLTTSIAGSIQQCCSAILVPK